MSIEVRVNGQAHSLDVDPSRPLLSVLRDQLGLTGAKFGCGEGECGACTVLLDGALARACVVKMGEVAGQDVVTIEGLGEPAAAVRRAFVELGAMQCAFCTPGMVVAASALLAHNSRPTAAEIVAAMDGNVCRCGTYPRIVAAVLRASELMGDAVSAGLPGIPGLAGAAASSAAPGLTGAAASSTASGLTGAAASSVGSSATPGGTVHGDVPCQPFEVTLRTEDGERTEVCLLPADGLVALLVQSETGPPRPGGHERHGGGDDGGPESIGAWVHVAPDGTVTGYTGKVEVGQGNRTSLAQMVAEELRAPADRVGMVMGDTARTPWDMGTFGSLSTPQAGTQLRLAAAAARELQARGEQGIHVVRGGQGAGRMTPPAEWGIAAGRPVPRAGGEALVAGTHRYTSDLRLPGMLYGKVLRPPRAGATLVDADVEGARSVPGAIPVRDGDFVGVAAPATGLAVRALGAIRATWEGGSHLSSGELFGHLRATAEPRPDPGPATWNGPLHLLQGDPDAAIAAAQHILAHTYSISPIAHVPLETRAAVARWDGTRLTVWTGTQRPFPVRDALAEAFGIPSDDVRVIVPDTGSGYGGKHTPECALEAARLARATGHPVRVVWTREEEFRWAYLRPAGIIDVRTAFSSDGLIAALDLDNINCGPAGIRPVYAIANQRLVFRPARSPVREGSYRALAATANHFAREMHVDEIAEMLKLDAVELRLRNLTDPRAKDVLTAAAERFGWGAGVPEAAAPGTRRAAGIALGFEKGSYVATAAEIEIPEAWDGHTAAPGRPGLRVIRALTAFDCGAIVNPDNLRNQITGALIMGLGGALFEAIDLEDGAVANARLSEYRVPRFSDVPEIDVVVLDRKDARPVGAGETPIVAIAPAIGAALAKATGRRLRGLPMAR